MIFSVEGHIEQIINGSKTQTRRRAGWATLPTYRRGRTYSIQPKRGKKGIPEGRILIVNIRKEMGVIRKDEYISEEDAQAEGGYTPEEFEVLFSELYPAWRARFAYTFSFLPRESFYPTTLQDSSRTPNR